MIISGMAGPDGRRAGGGTGRTGRTDWEDGEGGEDVLAWRMAGAEWAPYGSGIGPLTLAQLRPWLVCLPVVGVVALVLVLLACRDLRVRRPQQWCVSGRGSADWRGRGWQVQPIAMLSAP